MKWKLKRTQQCAKCPWRKDCDPHEIPNGYSKDKHAALKDTIATDPLRSLNSNTLRIMACHETHDAHCIGWLVNQCGRGNHIGLRIQMMSCENRSAIKLVGEQHETFKETLPKT